VPPAAPAPCLLLSRLRARAAASLLGSYQPPLPLPPTFPRPLPEQAPGGRGLGKVGGGGEGEGGGAATYWRDDDRRALLVRLQLAQLTAGVRARSRGFRAASAAAAEEEEGGVAAAWLRERADVLMAASAACNRKPP
jgi:hypothetical protein